MVVCRCHERAPRAAAAILGGHDGPDAGGWFLFCFLFYVVVWGCHKRAPRAAAAISGGHDCRMVLAFCINSTRGCGRLVFFLFFFLFSLSLSCSVTLTHHVLLLLLLQFMWRLLLLLLLLLLQFMWRLLLLLLFVWRCARLLSCVRKVAGAR